MRTPRRLHLPLTLKVALSSAALISATGACLIWAATGVASRWVERTTQERLELLYRTAGHVFAGSNPEISIRSDADGSVIAISSTFPVEDPDNAKVDAISSLTNGVASLFARNSAGELIRVATTVRKPDGSRLTGIPMDRFAPVAAAMAEGKVWTGQNMAGGIKFSAKFVPITDPRSREVIGALGTAIPRTGIESIIADLDAELAKPLLVLVPALALLSCLLTWLVLRPFNRVIVAMVALARAAGRVEIPYRNRSGVVGDAARAVCLFQESMTEREALLAAEREEGDRRQRLQLATEARIAEFRKTIVMIMSAMSDQMGETRACAGKLSLATSQADGQAHRMAAASQQISSNTLQIAHAMEEMAAGVGEIADQTATTCAKVDAMEHAAAGSKDRMTQLARAAETIGAVTGMIKALADQTNLLSLNATIEAARAGSAGRGFAIVAQEVKALASQTMRSTEQIGGLVASIQEQTSQAVALFAAMSDLAGEARAAAGAVSAAITQQQAVNSEIARSVADTSGGASELAIGIDGVSRVIAETKISAGVTSATADALAANNGELAKVIDNFLESVKAA